MLDGVKDWVEHEEPEEVTTIKTAQEEFAEDFREVTGQQKLICIPDRSEVRWRVVEEAYEPHEFASGDEEAK